MSAANGQGLGQLSTLVAERLAGGFVKVEIETATGNGKLLSWLTQHAEELERSYTDDTSARVRLVCRMARRFVNAIEEPNTNLRYLEEADTAEMPRRAVGVVSE